MLLRAVVIAVGIVSVCATAQAQSRGAFDNMQLPAEPVPVAQGAATIPVVAPDWCGGFQARQARPVDARRVIDQFEPGRVMDNDGTIHPGKPPVVDLWAIQSLALVACDAAQSSDPAQRDAWIARWRQRWENQDRSGDASQRRTLRFFVQHPGDLRALQDAACQSVPRVSASAGVARYEQESLRAAVGCEPGHGADAALQLSETSWWFDTPGFEPSPLARMRAVDDCLHNAHDAGDWAYCAHDLARVDVAAARAQIDAATSEPFARLSGHRYAAHLDEKIKQLAAAWDAKVREDALLRQVVDVPAQAEHAWSDAYAHDREAIDRAVSVEKALYAGGDDAAGRVCGDAVPRFHEWLATQSLSSAKDLAIAVGSPTGAVLRRVVELCELAEHRLGLASITPSPWPQLMMHGPRLLARTMVIARLEEVAPNHIAPLDTRNMGPVPSMAPPLPSSRGGLLGGDKVGRIKSLRPDGEYAIVSFAKASAKVSVPYGCVEGRLYGVNWDTGRLYREMKCQYREVSVDDTPTPVRIARVNAGGLKPGLFLRYYQVNGGDDAFPETAAVDGKGEHLAAAYGVPLSH